MNSTYDFEKVADDLIAKIQSGLNDKITAINSEKSDPVVLDLIDADAYYFQDLDNATVNHDPFVFYAITNAETIGDHLSATATKLEMVIAICIANLGVDTSYSRRLFRYQRAMREVIESQFDSLETGVKMSIVSQVPIELTLMNDSFRCRAIGLNVRLDLG